MRVLVVLREPADAAPEPLGGLSRVAVALVAPQLDPVAVISKDDGATHIEVLMRGVPSSGLRTACSGFATRHHLKRLRLASPSPVGSSRDACA